jgi:hypothetical protein
MSAFCYISVSVCRKHTATRNRKKWSILRDKKEETALLQAERGLECLGDQASSLVQSSSCCVAWGPIQMTSFFLWLTHFWNAVTTLGLAPDLQRFQSRPKVPTFPSLHEPVPVPSWGSCGTCHLQSPRVNSQSRQSYLEAMGGPSPTC